MKVIQETVKRKHPEKENLLMVVHGKEFLLLQAANGRYYPKDTAAIKTRPLNEYKRKESREDGQPTLKYSRKGR